MSIDKIRSIGISAHIDSGKTTLTERVLYYTKKIHSIHDVKGKDGVGATMDFMELERERGITIGSAVTNCTWKDYSINIIDTPGHVDFTIEVERSLRVLDGSILVLCAVGGVQSQSITVTRQMDRYKIPRIAFVNKCDRTGANPLRVAGELKKKLGLNAIPIQYPIGAEGDYAGAIDLVNMKAYTHEGSQGEKIIESDIPAELLAKAEAAREEMLDGLSMFSEELTEAMLDEKVTPELIRKTIRFGAINLKCVPVMMGSAYKNKGVQLLLDGVGHYLPNPSEKIEKAFDADNKDEIVELDPNPDKPTVSLAFKLEDGQYGQLTHVRVYQGKIKKGDELKNTRTGRSVRIGRLIKMHADEMEEIASASAGELVALFGVDCASGDTFCSPSLNYVMSKMHVPEPVISLSIAANDSKSETQLSKALNRFTKEDPTFRAFVDPESNQTIIQGMGELHLEVYVERMKREYGIALTTGAPQVAYREAITKRTEFAYLHKKQSGGSGQFAKVCGFFEPTEDADFVFSNEVKGGNIPTEYIPAVEKGFQLSMKKGRLIGFPIVRFKVTINDGQSHAVDSSDMAFQLAAQGAIADYYEKAGPVILEPIMKVSCEGPTEFQGAILASLNQRRGVILSASEDGFNCRVDAEVPLADMFGYSTVIRSSTQGKAEFTMEFMKYGKVPQSKSE
ncbi:MAG: elongation factor G, partial [Fibrobacteres bacterium]|nr:elongation factor G [Fibrobacterota bacterium]